jgi:hypothetical protein
MPSTIWALRASVLLGLGMGVSWFYDQPINVRWSVDQPAKFKARSLVERPTNL